MKKIIMLLSGVFLLQAAAHAEVYINGYTKKDGTYVEPHYRSDPNGTTSDNWSTQGNTNPHTGQEGTRDPSNESPSWNAPSGNSWNR